MAKTNRKGRNNQKQGRFVRLGHDILLSDAFLSLTPNARSLLIVLISRFTKRKGSFNNGEFWLSESDGADLMGVSSQKTARSAFSELSDAGLILMTKNAYFNIKSGERRARCWRLTWKYNDRERAPASNEWQSYKPPENSTAERRMKRGQGAVFRYKKELSQKQITGANFTAMEADAQTIPVKNTPMGSDGGEKLRNHSQSIPVKNTPHIAIPVGRGEAGSVLCRMIDIGLDPFDDQLERTAIADAV